MGWVAWRGACMWGEGGGGGAYIVNVDWVTYLGAYIHGGLIYGGRIYV